MKGSRLQELVSRLRERFFYTEDTCLVCGRSLPAYISIAICLQCFSQVPLVRGNYCRHCGRPLRTGKGVCTHCRRFSPRYLSVVRSLGIYEGMLQEWLYRVKYHGEVRLAGALGKLMALYLGQYPELKCDCLIPVPLYREQQIQRGYNQSFVLAEEIARWRKIPVLAEAVTRTLRSQAQSGLGVAHRIRNVGGGFRVAAPSLIQGKVVLLIEDIYTTGATLNELARILLRTGAKEVKGYCLAVSLNDEDFSLDANGLGFS